MEGSSGWFSQVSLTKVLHNLELVSVKVTRNDKALSSDNNDLLALQETFGNHGGKSTHEVTVTVDNFDSVELVCHLEVV